MALIHPGRWLTAAAVLAVLGGGWLFVHPLRSGPHRLAVLPLRNGTGDPTLDSVAEGLTSELINNLSRSLSRGGKVHVLSRTTTRPYAQAGKSLPQIARELDADEVVEWDLFRSEGRFRIAINLFGKDDQPIWSSELSEAESNLFALQALLTRTLAARLDPEPQVGQALSVLPADAHRAYLRGLYWLDFPKEDVTSVDKAISAFQEAVHLAPDFAEGWSTLAAALSFRGLFTDGGRVADITHARAAAERALHLDPNLPEAQIAMGGHQLWSEWNWREAESSIRKGLASSPNSVSGHEALGWFYMTQGRVDEALQEGRIACKLDPLSLRWRASLAVLLIFAHRYEEAQAEAEEGLRMEPDSERLHNFAGWAAMERKRYGEWLPHEQALKGNPPHWMEDLREAVRKGEREVLELALARYRKEGDDFSTAQTLSRLGRNEEALDLLDSLYGHHPPVMTLILTDPSFLGLHGHPRFKAILRRMELPGG